MGVATACETVSALAPGLEALIFTTGGVICGYWSTGNMVSPMMPMMTISIEITIEKTGLSIKKLTFIFSKVSPRPSPNEREEEFLLNYTFLSISGKGNHSVSFFSADGWGKVALTFIPGVSL